MRRARGNPCSSRPTSPAAFAPPDIIFVSVNTPTKLFGQGARSRRSADWEKTARRSSRNPTREDRRREIDAAGAHRRSNGERILNSNSRLRFQVLSNPEFLAEGSAVEDLESPDRVLIGSEETEEGVAPGGARRHLRAVGAERRIIQSNIWSAELSKLTANAFLAQRISSINSISALCEKTEADVDEVARAVGTDSRIGPKFLKASVGFGGSCFKKDILNLVYIAESYGLSEVAPLLGSGGADERVAGKPVRAQHGGEHVQHHGRQAHRARSASPSRPTPATRANRRRSRSPPTSSPNAPTWSSPIRRRSTTPVRTWLLSMAT